MHLHFLYTRPNLRDAVKPQVTLHGSKEIYLCVFCAAPHLYMYLNTVHGAAIQDIVTIQVLKSKAMYTCVVQWRYYVM